MASQFNNIKKNKLSKGVRASIAFFLSSLVTKGISYIVTPIYTRILTSSEFGQVATYMTWVQVFGIVAMFCLSYGVFDNGLLDYEDRRDEYSFSMLVLSNIITVIFFCVFAVVYPFVFHYLDITTEMIIVMGAMFVVQPAYNFWCARKRFEYDYKPLVTSTICCAVLSPLCAIVWILLSESDSKVEPRVFGAQIPLIIVYSTFYYYIAKKAGYKVNRNYWKQAVLFNIPLIPHYLSTYLLSSSDKLMISYFVGNQAVAFYSVAHSVAAVANIIWTSANGSLVPYTYQKCREKDYGAINRVTLPLLSFFVLASVCVILLAPEVVRIMAPGEYSESIFVIPPIVGSVFFQVQYYVYANVVYYYKKPKYVMIGSITAVVVNLVMNYIFIPQFGYLAAGYTTLFSYALQAVIDYFGMKKAADVSVYNMKFILLLSVTLVVISLISNLSYQYTVIRYLVLTLILLAALLNRKKVFEVFNQLKEKSSNE